ncbi:MAG: cell division protein CrgA [Actinobacteria bacterium]|nr:MAG: cell division protein CrgA [Actinomycetota bacterium]
MPKSKGRPKQRISRYQLEPQHKKKVKASPRWYGPLMLALMGIGVVAIVWNYTRGDQASNMVLMGGLGIIAVGFFGVTFWR